MTNVELIQYAHDNNKLVKSVKSNQYYNASVDAQGRPCISLVGGGFVTPAVAIKEDSVLELVDGLPTEYKKGVFHLDGERHLIFEGYAVPERRWNGWAMPVFEIDVAKRIMEVANATMGEFYAFTRDDEKGQFVVEEFDWESTDELNDFPITVDGKEIVVVSFMGGNWTWEDCYGEEADKMLARYVSYDKLDGDEELPEPQDPDLPLVLYHGTSVFNLESMAEEGINAPSYWGSLETALEHAEKHGAKGVVVSMHTAENKLSANVQLSESIAEQDEDHKVLSEDEVLRSLEELESVVCHDIVSNYSVTKHFSTEAQAIIDKHKKQTWDVLTKL